jgi:hypothetical protein
VAGAREAATSRKELCPACRFSAMLRAPLSGQQTCTGASNLVDPSWHGPATMLTVIRSRLTS